MNHSRRAFLKLLSAGAVPPAASAEARGGRLWIRLRNEHGGPIAARVYLRGADGRYHVPSGSLAREIGRTKETFFHADGGFQIELPAGAVTIDVVKGFEYAPASAELKIAPGRTTAAEIVLRRTANLPARGWHSGDVHMHPNHVDGGVYMTMEDCRLYALAEDIRVANLMISSAQSPYVFDLEYFSGGRPEPLSTPETLMVVQQEFRNTSAMYGHMCLMGITRLVEPFFTGEPDSPHWEDYPPNYVVARAAQEQGGAVCYTHPARAPAIPVGAHLAREFPIDLALGVVDALDVLGNGDEEGACWMYYRVLNCGLKCAASSGSDSRMDVMRHAVSGGGKVYVKAGNPLAYPKWLAAYKAGRTFVTNGPLLSLDVEGHEPGDELRLPSPRTVRVRANAQSILPMSVLELIVNGEVVASAKPAGDGLSAECDTTVPLERSAWIAARVWGPGHRFVVNDPKLFSHTSPVYCRVGDTKVASRRDAELVMRWIDRLLEDVAASPRFASAERRGEVVALFKKGRRYYEQVAAGA